MPNQQETIPLSITSGNKESTSSSILYKNDDIADTNIYAIFFKQKFNEDFPDKFEFSVRVSGGNLNAFKFKVY